VTKTRVSAARSRLRDQPALVAHDVLDGPMSHEGRCLLVIDEVGCLAFDNRAADLLFQIVARRYERKSLVSRQTSHFESGDALPERHVRHRPALDSPKVVDALSHTGHGWANLTAPP
jgi:DNA replication protein DnaC